MVYVSWNLKNDKCEQYQTRSPTEKFDIRKVNL